MCDENQDIEDGVLEAQVLRANLVGVVFDRVQIGANQLVFIGKESLVAIESEDLVSVEGRVENLENTSILDVMWHPRRNLRGLVNNSMGVLVIVSSLGRLRTAWADTCFCGGYLEITVKHRCKECRCYTIPGEGLI